MNYQRQYDQLISKALVRKLNSKYMENHHIKPRCLFPKGTQPVEVDKNNLVSLTYQEHYLAHLLLTKIYPENYGLKMAMQYFVQPRKVNNNNGYIKMLNGRQYATAKKVAYEGRIEFMNKPETKKANSERRKAYFANNPEALTAMSERTKAHFADPEARKAHSERRKSYIANNPEFLKLLSEKQLERYAKNPEILKVIGENTKRWFANNPEAVQVRDKKRKDTLANPEIKKIMRDKQIARFADPEERKAQSARIKAYFANNPEAKKANSERRKAYFANNPEAKKANSERLKAYYANNPEAKKVNSARQKASIANNPEAHKAKSEKCKKECEVTLSDGQIIRKKGAAVMGALLGINKVMICCKCRGSYPCNPRCKNEPYIGLSVVKARYIDQIGQVR